MLVFGGVAFAATETATATLKTTIGETTANSGIRITATTPAGGNSGFDTEFATAGTTLMLDHTSSNSEIDNVNGTFAVLVKRGASTAITVSLTANPLTHPSYATRLPYTLTSTTNLAAGVNNMISVVGIAVSDTYEAVTLPNTLMRHVNEFTYDIPAFGSSAFYGEYSGDIVFTITLE